MSDLDLTDVQNALEEEMKKSGNKSNGWIPCSERLPKTNGVYQITRQVTYGGKAYGIINASYFDGQDTWHDDNRVNHGREYLNDVIAWMPLPEPYKESED